MELTPHTTLLFSCMRKKQMKGVPPHSCTSLGVLGLNSSQSVGGKSLNQSQHHRRGVWPLGNWSRMRWTTTISPCQLSFIWGSAWWEQPFPVCFVQLLAAVVFVILSTAKQWRRQENLYFGQRDLQLPWITCGFLVKLRYFLLCGAYWKGMKINCWNKKEKNKRERHGHCKAKGEC